MKKIVSLLFILLFASYVLQAKETPVDPSTFVEAYNAAEDGDVLLLADGEYTFSKLKFPAGAIVTLKAAEGANPVLKSTEIGSESADGGGLIFDGIDIDRGADQFIYAAAGVTLKNVRIIAFRNLTIKNVGRCIFRSNDDVATPEYTIAKIEFTNCIITNCGTNGWGLLFPRHEVKEVSVTNSTLYNYVGGENFFRANNGVALPNNEFKFTFENNTVYKWANGSNRALCNTADKYGENSTYIFRNNIITVPGVAGMEPMIVNTASGTVIGENNLIVDYGSYVGGNQTISDLTLAGLGLTSIEFANPESGDFTLPTTSPLATAGKDGKCVGDPRWFGILQSITTPTNEKNIVSVKYFDILGRQISEDVKGIVIVRKTYEDGSIAAEKQLK